MSDAKVVKIKCGDLVVIAATEDDAVHVAKLRPGLPVMTSGDVQHVARVVEFFGGVVVGVKK